MTPRKGTGGFFAEPSHCARKRYRRKSLPSPFASLGNALTIYFYRTGDEYGWCSNFAPYPNAVDGKEWPTSEHYFQSQKFEDESLRERIRSADSPAEAAKIGRNRSLPLRDDWEQIKMEVMRTALRAKFTQHRSLRDALIQTGEAEIVEHTNNDSYWGDGGDGSGANMLGKLLMEIREELVL